MTSVRELWDNIAMRILYLLLIILITYGCAAKKLAIQNADSLVSYQLNKRLHLYSDQRKQLARDVESLLNKSKPLALEVLPIIDDIDLKNHTRVEEQYSALEVYFKKISKDSSALVAKHMAKLDQKQQKKFFETLADENREILRKDKEERIEGLEFRLKMILGPITPPQKQIISEYGSYFESRAKQRLDRRNNLHKEFIIIFQKDVSSASKETQFQDAFLNYQEKIFDNNKNLEILKKLLPTISDKQRKHFRKLTEDISNMIKYFNSVEY